MIRQDIISIGFSIAAVSAFLFWTTFGGQLFQASVIAGLMLLSGFVFNRLIHRGDVPEDEEIDQEEGRGILLYSGLAIVVFFGLAFFVPLIPPGYLPSLAVTSLATFTARQLFLLLIAVSEEQFFRGFLANFFIERVGVFGIPLNGVVFMVYHLGVYGTSGINLLIVLGAGTTLAFIAYVTGRVSPCILGHVFNNAWASGVIQNV